MLAGHERQDLNGSKNFVEKCQSSQPQSVQQKDQHDHPQSRCQGDQCGHMVLLVTATVIQSAPSNYSFYTTPYLNHPQLVVSRDLRPPILLG